MPYIKETIKAGKTIEITKSYSGRYGSSGIPRANNRKKTPEQMQEANRRQAEKKLRGLLNANYAGGDIHAVLTYKKEDRPQPDQASKNLSKFFRCARKVYRDSGIELKYIGVTEYKSKAIHHHVILKSIDPRELQKIWPHGKVRPTFLDNSGDYAQLAAYLIKETDKTFREPGAPCKKRWSSSKNLTQPKIKKEVIRSIKYAEQPTPKRGYYIIPSSVIDGINPVTGYPFQNYRMVQIE